jgi:hypothetical protein
MGLTNWDEVLPAFERAIEELNKKIRHSNEAALQFLKDAGILELEEAAEKQNKETSGPESTL